MSAGVVVYVFDSRNVPKDHPQAVSKHAKGEESKEPGEPKSDQPLNLEVARFLIFRDEVSKHARNVAGQQQAVEVELDEELVAPLANDTTNPRAEVIHLQRAASNILVVVGTLGFPDVAFRAPEWQSLRVTREDDLRPEFF